MKNSAVLLIVIALCLFAFNAEANPFLRMLFGATVGKQIGREVGREVAKGLAANAGKSTVLDVVNTGATAVTAYAMLGGGNAAHEGNKSSQYTGNGIQEENISPRSGVIEYCNPRESLTHGYVVLVTRNQDGQLKEHTHFPGDLMPSVCRREGIAISGRTAAMLEAGELTIMFTDSGGDVQEDIQLTLSL